MKTPGPCTCPRPCHAWAAATTNPATLTSPAWAGAWRQAATVGYHPGGAGVTVLDLDNPQAVAWAHQHMPATCTVPSTRGEHWIYRGVMQSANSVRPGADIKSHAAYARWLGPGNTTPVELPAAVRTLVRKEEATAAPRGGPVASSTPALRWSRAGNRGCSHNESYISAGLAKGVAKILAHQENGAASQAFGVARFLAQQHRACSGPCDLGTLPDDLIAAAVSVGVPHAYAARAVTNGIAAGGRA